MKQTGHRTQFLQQINFIDLPIKITTVEPNIDWSIPLLDTLFMLGPYNTLLAKLYRKPTHTDHNLHWDSHHNLQSTVCINTLTHRARTVCVNPQLMQKEEDHINEALPKYKLPNWALNRFRIKNNHKYYSNNSYNNKQLANNHTKDNNIHIVVLCTEGLSDSFRNM